MSKPSPGLLRALPLCVPCGRIRCRSTRFAHSAHVTVVSLGWQEQHCSSSGDAPHNVGALAKQHLATRAFDARLKATQCDLVLEVIPQGSTQPTDVGHYSIAQQNSIDRPVDISLGPNLAHVHDATLDQRHPLTASSSGLGRLGYAEPRVALSWSIVGDPAGPSGVW